ncbi:Rpn family recombination-promoting nuclease/putative transposase [Sporosarcina sp. ACRSM]|uniref:Rpn family recombination-promoting nuclease/putative transposase n=1 Tax=Sporosarcina sp. ACRSM TaxID=2918216 RepID=UPI001EF6878E|nr:Rpn family recombination-promoting nuclease/putative transposase [Sporosarcina sp. ACRSM]MCG7335921.1 Rpn family recombination-promoting nuclease/putative transposase [Sporosarcina sp. ACRSM]
MVSLLRENNEVYEVDLLDLRNDVVFKTFFGDRRNNKLLLDFLNAILGGTILSVELTDPNLELTHANDKLSVMDIRVVTDQGKQINVEIQLRGHQAFPERMLMYWAKMYASQDEVGKDYILLKKAIQIVITNFKMLSKKHFHSMFQLIDPEDGTVFSDHLEIHVLELPKFRKYQLHDMNALEKWLLFLKSDKQTKEELAMESPIMKEAFEEIQRLSQDPKTRALAISREIQLKDQMQREYEARMEGMAKGIEQGIADIVISIYRKPTPVPVIAELTGISPEKIMTIIESNTNIADEGHQL